MSSFSHYSINLAESPNWRPGEDIAAGAFVGMTLFLFVEVNVLIYRAFKKWRGLYFWSMQLGSLGVFFETLGLMLKFFGSPGTDAIWPLYTLFIVGGGATCMPAQSLVLYSRLHLVIQNQKNTALCLSHGPVLIFRVRHSQHGHRVAGVQHVRSSNVIGVVTATRHFESIYANRLYDHRLHHFRTLHLVASSAHEIEIQCSLATRYDRPHLRQCHGHCF